jgi:predicted DNA-binding transcriptional regulator AlpA
MSKSTTYTVTITPHDDNTAARRHLAETQEELMRLVAKEAVEEYIRATRHHNTASKHEPVRLTAPAAGFYRLPQVLALIPVGKTTWWQGIRSGRFPGPVKLSPRCTAWRANDIQKLAQEFSELGQKT